MTVNVYHLGLYRVDLTSRKGRVAWVILRDDRIVGRGISTAADSAFDILRALSTIAFEAT